MKIEYLSLVNYAGIYAGTLLDRIDIDFTKCINKMIVIKGDGGSGKSTIMNAFSLFPDSNRDIRVGYSGQKSGILNNNGQIYKFKIYYEWNPKTNSRSTTRCFIQKQTVDGFVELNSGGTVRSYFDILETEFGIDPNFISLSYLSTEDKGIVAKTPAERKKAVGYALDDIEVYNNMNKVFSKKSNIVKAMLNAVSAKINSIGTEENINNTLTSLEQQILLLSKERDKLMTTLGKIDNEISTLDPDGTAQSMKKELIEKINLLTVERNKHRSMLNYYATHEKHALVDNELKDTSLAMEKLLSINLDRQSLVNKRDDMKSKLQELLSVQEEESRAIELKTQRLLSLQSECIYDNIEEQISKYKAMINEYEKVFDSMHITDALSITKDEYVTGLNVLKDIKDLIDATRSFVYPYTLEESTDAILNNVDIMREYNSLLEKKSIAENNLISLGNDYNYNRGLLEKMSALELRPTKCNIDTCPFIKDALEASKKKPQEKLDILDEQITLNQKDFDVYSKRITELEDVLQCVANLKIIIRNIEVNRAIISKLPVKDLFLNKHNLLQKIANQSPFNEINEIYSSISIAGMFEDYKIAKDNLYKLETDYKLYESRNIILEELNTDIETLNNKLNVVLNDIKNKNAEIRAIDSAIVEKEIIYDATDKFIRMIKQFQSINSEVDELTSRLDKVTSNMSKLDSALERRLNISVDLQRVAEQLEPIMSQREQLNYQLDLLNNYKVEYQELSDKYTKLELVKRYSSPSKEGIQNRFIEVYMNETRVMANEILKLFFGGRLELYPYDLSDGFRIPCYSYFSNMLQNDVSDCSRSEKAMASLAISISLMNQASSSSSYNILKLDEIDEGLDAQNANAFMPALHRIFDILNIEQCLMVTHSDKVDLSSCDIIQLRRINVNDDDMSQGNYIFTL